MRKHRISRLMEEAVIDGIFPGAVLLFALKDNIVFHESFGMADIFDRRKMEKDSIFDLASLTKPLATALAVSRLVGRESLFLDQKLGSIIEDFQDTEKADITVDMLLRHKSGFPAHREYFKKLVKKRGDSKKYLWSLLVKEPLEAQIDEQYIYSDLGYMVLSWAIETVSGKRLDRFVQDEIYAPLGIRDLFFIEPDKRSEFLNDPRIVSTQRCPWRDRVLTGEVDDDNAWAAGGVQGHAGLFGNALSVHRLCCEILAAIQGGNPEVIDSSVLKKFAEKRGNEKMVGGFCIPSGPDFFGASCGRYFSGSSLGYVGFTGTSFWIDPEKSVIIVLLTNRGHPLRANEGIKDFRPRIHDCILSEF